ncbi:zinc ribbon domain-containing protein [Hathewaya massiliensis]|uniref:zinc ribbon domain-containing protein n=1 Tax=Hathewaya massiliensis TaxID=1964382 RepID=UPI00115770C0|nr:zinc ribbon domain-containing protein [Hathewaya massiliensis]
MALFKKEELKDAFSKISVSAKDAAETVLKATKEGANTVAKKSNELVQVSKLNMSISSEEGKIEELYREIGKSIFEKFDNNVYIDPDLVPVCENIKGHHNNISEMKEKISELRNVRTCATCGIEISEDTKFCSKCGAEQPKEEEYSPCDEEFCNTENIDSEIEETKSEEN